MHSTRVLAAPGLRTDAQPGWRASVAGAFGSVIAQPRLWALGICGFALRGGVVLLALPITVLPTPVEARLILGDLLGTTGFTDRFWIGLAAAAVASAIVMLGLLAVLARLELTGFRLIVQGDEQPRPAPRRPIFVQLLAVEVIAFVCLLAAAGPGVQGAVDTAYSELTRPTSAAPIYQRVLDSIWPLLAALGVAVLVIEMVSALTARELLARDVLWRESHLPGPVLARAFAAALARLVRRPVRVLATALLGWLTSIALLLPGLAILAIAWAGVRATFLTSVSMADPNELIEMFLMSLALGAAFALAMALGGFASALRGALWSVERLR